MKLCDGSRLGFDAFTITLPGADVHGGNTTNSFFISLFFHTAVTIANQGAVLILADLIYRQICRIWRPAFECYYLQLILYVVLILGGAIDPDL